MLVAAVAIGLLPMAASQSSPTNELSVSSSNPLNTDDDVSVGQQDFEDADLRRTAQTDPRLLQNLNIIETDQEFDDATLNLTELRHKSKLGNTFFFVMHDNQDEAFDAMIWAVATFGGTGIAIENREQRLLEGGVDLNLEFGRSSRPDLNYVFRTHIERADITIALHNNQTHPTGSLHLNNPAYFTETCDAGDSVDDIVIMGDISSGDPGFCDREHVQQMTAKGLNVAWTRYGDRRSEAFDCRERCSFRKFVISYLGRTYFNLEARHGNGSQKQKKQVCNILDPETATDACKDLG